MKRRSFVQNLGLISSHALFPAILSGFLSRCSQGIPAEANYTPQFFGANEWEQIQKIIDIILPATQSPSASEVGVHFFLDEVFAQCLPQEAQPEIKQGLERLTSAFSETDDPEGLLAQIDQKAFSGDPATAYFRPIKQYSLVGFFTSQAGMTQASNYVKIPGEYQGEIEMDANTLNYGKTNLQYYL